MPDIAAADFIPFRDRIILQIEGSSNVPVWFRFLECFSANLAQFKLGSLMTLIWLLLTVEWAGTAKRRFKLLF